MRWIIGDIHGMLRPLKTLLEAVALKDQGAQLLFAGDFVNRGPDSRGVIDLLLSLQNARFVRGNHDDIFDQVLHGRCYAANATRDDRIAAFQWFMKYGLDSTFISYGADIAYLEHLARYPTIEGLDALVQWVPETHRNFIQSLPPVIEFDDLFVLHGKWSPDEPSESPGIAERLLANPHLRHALLWGRYTSEEIYRLKAWRRTGHFGHTPVSHYGHLPNLLPSPKSKTNSTSGDAAAAAKTPSQEDIPNGEMLPLGGNKMVLLDTAAALGTNGRLTAYCPDTHEFLQASHFGELVVG